VAADIVGERLECGAEGDLVGEGAAVGGAVVVGIDAGTDGGVAVEGAASASGTGTNDGGCDDVCLVVELGTGAAGRDHLEPVEQLLMRLGDQLHAGDCAEPDQRLLQLS
jgi:hypothetical protein